MLKPRIIPCLLVHKKGLVKSINFKNYKYVGDPLNAVRIFNEKEVDEIIILDIDATVQNKKPDFKMVENIATECNMPICYGGGIKTVEDAQKIFSLGVEKIAISSAAISDSSLMTKMINIVGSQSIVVVLDVKKNFLGTYEIFINNGKVKTNKNLIDFVKELEKLGIGEVIINSIDQDGVMKGYDLNLIEKVRNAVNIPITALGGAGSLEDIQKIINKFGLIGAAAGSLFVFKGVYKAVLINYPSRKEKDALIANSYKP
jgi:imidazole glycerol-phosphate synthase subunit HisF